MKVKQSKLTKKLKGEGSTIRFPAADGSKFRGTLTADGITAANVTIEGPAGAVPFEFREQKGKVTIRPLTLAAGTGDYEVRVEDVGPVKYNLQSSRPKP